MHFRDSPSLGEIEETLLELTFLKVFGELGEECGEAYLSYGKALFQLAVMENEVLDSTASSSFQNANCTAGPWKCPGGHRGGGGNYFFRYPGAGCFLIGPSLKFQVLACM